MTNGNNSFSQRIFRLVLRVLPFDFRANYEREMAGVFAEQRREMKNERGFTGMFKLWMETLAGLFRIAPREHWDIFRQDCAYAFRMMRANRGFTAIAVLTLAFGIGANAAIFSVVHSVLLQPLPYKKGQQLIYIRQQATKLGVDDAGWSVPSVLDFRAQNHTLSSLVEYHHMSFILYKHGDPDRVKTGVVSWNYFDAFGITPILGHSFLSRDDEIGAPAVALLSYEYWQRKFGGDPDVVGKSFEMNDRIHTVVGVLPPIPQYPDENDMYMPTADCPSRSSKAMREDRSVGMVNVFGRLKPGMTLAQAQADLSTVAAHLQAEHPKDYPVASGYGVKASLLKSNLTRAAQPTLLTLLAAAGFVLLIACANVANLTLSRMARRERELAVRSALGAGRSRLFRQLLTESLILALFGGVIGLLLAYDSLGLLINFTARLSPRAHEIRIDSGVLLFTLFVALGTSMVFGTFSALFSRIDLTSRLREGAGSSGIGLRRNRLRNALIVSQVAFSFVLLVGAGLMLHSLLKMLQVKLGFVPQHALAVRLSYNWSEYGSTEKVGEMAKKLVDSIQTQPGVLSAAVSSAFPLEPDVLTGGPASNRFQIEGQTLAPGQVRPRTETAVVSPGFFRALGIPLLAGREFAPNDDASVQRVAIINKTMERRFWPNGGALGKKISLALEMSGDQWWQIVGVVGDVHNLGVDRKPMMQVYVPMAQNSMSLAALVVRTAADPATMGPQVTRAIHQLDPQMAVSKVITLDDALADSLASPRTTAILLVIFAGLALLIATAGIGGIMALAVSQRLKEIGIRIALGAQPSRIMLMVLRQGVILAAVGVAIGLCGAFALTGFVKTLLFEVTPTDPITYAAVAFIFVGAALIAAYMPARRAAAIDPIEALRCE
ncbi:MAG TPA: ABC transporter permease [Verrucomicrobiae bacterium]|nr:ABC transporter permease [Verrucomicrobiae bacterium]